MTLPVVSLMAGELPGEGHKYRPFLDVAGSTVVQRHVDAVLRGVADPHLVFAILDEHDRRFGVSDTLAEVVAGRCTFEIVRLRERTSGPAQTAVRAIEAARIEGPVLVSDVDHAVDPRSLLLATGQPDVACVLPTWSLRGEDLRNWAVAAVAGDRVVGIQEKRLPDGAGEFVGVIGCYWFADAAALARTQASTSARYLSGVVAAVIADGGTVVAVPMEQADFFGDQVRLATARARMGGHVGTLFCDLDGTIVEHEAKPRYDVALRPLPGSVERLQQWRDQGYLIVITSARDPQDDAALSRSLHEAGIPYDRLMLGLPSGPRAVINDRKPSSSLTPQAVAQEVDRDEGLARVPTPGRQLEVRRRMVGGSGAETLLVEDDEKFFVRKRVMVTPATADKVERLRLQYRQLERFGHLSPGITPALYGESRDSFEYYFDLEYLQEHREASTCTADEQERALEDLHEALIGRVYRSVFRSPTPIPDWLASHVERKIAAKLPGLRETPELAAILDADELIVNDARLRGPIAAIDELLELDGGRVLSPRVLGAAHGDLTLENVLWRPGDVRLIDMDGAEHLDALELDFGKLLQSVDARYETWGHDPKPRVRRRAVGEYDVDLPEASVIDLERFHATWAPILAATADEARAKGAFYLALHLIRMAPFRAEESIGTAQFALLLASRYLGSAREMLAS